MPSTPPPGPLAPSSSPLAHGVAGYGGAPLPLTLTSLIARDVECAAVSALLRDAMVRLLTLTGPGGVGKTRLAIAAASNVRTDFPDGITFINLAPITNPDLVLDTIAGSLGLRDMGTESLYDRLLGLLSDKRMLLVLDNFEQVITAGPRVRELLGGCPGVTLLVTSRTGLRLRGEREFPVAPLPLQPSASVDGIEVAGAVRLFAERAAEINPDFSLTAETLPVVAAIVGRLDGLPLAIELAAARMKVLSPTALLQRLEKRLPLLSGGPRDLPLRQQTMRDTIGWSYDLLTAADQALFRRLAVFAGGFTLGAAEAICFGAKDVSDGHPPYTRYDAVDGITALIDHSLLRQSPASGDEPRYTMLETVREYACDRLDASDEGDIVHRQHAAYFTALAEAADGSPSTWLMTAVTAGSFWSLRRKLIGTYLAYWLNRLETDHDNLRVALDWFAHSAEPESFLRLARSLSFFWLFHGPFEEGRTWLERALARDSKTSPLLRRDALFGLGLLAVNHGDVARAESCFSESLAMSQTHGDPAGVAYGWLGLGLVAMQQGRFGRAATHLEEAVTGARRLDDPLLGSVCAGIALGFLGASAYAQGALPLAESRYEAALLEQRAIDDRWGIGFSLVGWGYTARDQGHTERALALFTEGLGRFTEVGDRRIIALALDGVAGIAIAWGQPERAACLFGAAAVLREASGLQVETAFRAAHVRDVEAARAALGAEPFAAGWTTGAALPLPEAVAEASAVAKAAPRQAERLGLTPREAEVLKLLAEGLSDREIAESLYLSPRTVGWHVNHLLTKLDVPSRTAAATAAVRRGLV